MGIYGFGKAFNTRYVMGGQYSRRPHVNVRGGRPVMLGGSSFTKTTNVTINNGPTGFWGFMSGLFGGLFGGGLFGGGLFGGLFGGGMGMGMGMSPFGMINQAQMPVQNQPKGDRLADLQKMFPDWVITSDGNGHYDAVNKDQTIHEEGNFDEMCDKLLKHKKEEPQGPKEAPKAEDPNAEDPNAKKPAEEAPKNGNENGTGWSKASADDIKGYKGNITVNDFAEGGGQAINGKTEIGQPTEDSKGFPGLLTIKGYRYQFDHVDNNGQAYYKSLDGKGDIYRLEKNADGTFGLNQYDGDTGAGSVDITSRSGSAAPTPAPTPTPTPEPEPEPTPAPEPEPNTPQVKIATQQEKAQATNSGITVAEDLVGYTNSKEKARIINNISNLNADTVSSFIDGYNGNKGLGDPIITQISTEYGWSNAEKVQCYRKIVSSVFERAESLGIQVNKDILNSLNEQTYLPKQSAMNIDNYINQLNKQIKEKEAALAQEQQ